MIKSFVCVCGLLVSLNVVAASLKPVKGKVVDRFNNPLPGATIQVTHSPEKTITDVDGNFQLEVAGNAILKPSKTRNSSYPTSASVPSS